MPEGAGINAHPASADLLVEQARRDPVFRAWLLEQLPPAPCQSGKEKMVKDELPPLKDRV